MSRSRTRATTGSVVAAFLALASCGGDDSDDPVADQPPAISFAYTPDSIMLWMESEGIIDEMEAEYGIELIMTASNNDFTLFAGGQVDVISMGSFEIAPIEQETGIKTVTFGRFVNNANAWITRADTGAETLADLVGRQIGVRGGGSSVLTGSIIADAVHDLDFSEGGGDFELVLTDEHAINLDLLRRGDVDALVGPVTIAVPYLVSGELEMLYDGAFSFEVFSDGIGQQVGWGINNLIAREEWFEENQDEAAFLVAVIDRAADEWHSNKAAIMEKYPDEFAAETPEESAFLLDLFETHDYVVETAYLDQEYIDGETRIIEEMKRLGDLPEDAEVPRFEIIEPK